MALKEMPEHEDEPRRTMPPGKPSAREEEDDDGIDLDAIEDVSDEDGGEAAREDEQEDPLVAESRREFGEGYDELKERTKRRLHTLLADRKRVEAERDREREELAEMRGRWEREEAERNKSRDEERESRLSALAEELNEARADADLERAGKLEDERAQLREEKLRDELKRGEPRDTPAAPKASPNDGLHPQAKAWIEANKWFEDGSDPARRERALEINAQLRAEKMDHGTPQFYAELNRRLAAKPAGEGNDDGDDYAAASRRSPVMPYGRQQPPPRNTGKKFTKEDASTMRRYGFDPSSPADRKKYMRRNDPL